MLFSFMIEKQDCRYVIHRRFYCRSLHPFMNTIYLYCFRGFCAKTFTISTNPRLFLFELYLWVRDCLLLSVCSYSAEDNEAIPDLSLGTTIINLTTTIWTTCSHLRFNVKICKVSDRCWQSLYNLKQHPPPTSKVRTSLSEKINSHGNICTLCSAQREKRVYECRWGARSQMWIWIGCATQVTLFWWCQIW